VVPGASANLKDNANLQSLLKNNFKPPMNADRADNHLFPIRVYLRSSGAPG